MKNLKTSIISTVTNFIYILTIIDFLNILKMLIFIHKFMIYLKIYTKSVIFLIRIFFILKFINISIQRKMISQRSHLTQKKPYLLKHDIYRLY